MNSDLQERYARCVIATTPTMGSDVAKQLCESSVYGSRGQTSEKKTRRSTTERKKRSTQRRRRGSSFRRKH
jgi:hypothetical protein